MNAISRLLRRKRVLPYPPEMIGQARAHPNGWVYQIVGDYGPNDDVPGSAIKGAWKVGPDGTLTGEFEPNPGYHDPPEPATRP